MIEIINEPISVYGLPSIRTQAPFIKNGKRTMHIKGQNDYQESKLKLIKSCAFRSQKHFSPRVARPWHLSKHVKTSKDALLILFAQSLHKPTACSLLVWGLRWSKTRQNTTACSCKINWKKLCEVVCLDTPDRLSRKWDLNTTVSKLRTLFANSLVEHGWFVAYV